MFLHPSFSHSVHGEGGMHGGGVHGSGACVAGAWQGVCLAEGCMAEGVCMAGGACVAGRACIAGGMHGRGGCVHGGSVHGGMHGRRHALQGACMQDRRPLKWVVYLLLEYILVSVSNLIITTHFALHKLRNYDNHFFEAVTQCLFYNGHCKYV